MVKPTPPDLDALQAASQQGQLSQVLFQTLRARITARAEFILASLVAAHRADVLTELRARTGIAEISSLRAFLSTLEDESRQGQEAARQLYQ